MSKVEFGPFSWKMFLILMIHKYYLFLPLYGFLRHTQEDFTYTKAASRYGWRKPGSARRKPTMQTYRYFKETVKVACLEINGSLHTNPRYEIEVVPTIDVFVN